MPLNMAMLLLWLGHCDASMVWTKCLSMLVSMVHLCLLLCHIYRPLFVISFCKLSANIEQEEC
jgi:hypothetical protein